VFTRRLLMPAEIVVPGRNEQMRDFKISHT
jgi:hypothetical protein